MKHVPLIVTPVRLGIFVFMWEMYKTTEQKRTWYISTRNH